MKIELKEDTKWNFIELEVGATFLYKEQVYQKIMPVFTMPHIDGKTLNAILLCYGEAYYIPPNAGVFLIKGKFVQI